MTVVEEVLLRRGLENPLNSRGGGIGRPALPSVFDAFPGSPTQSPVIIASAAPSQMEFHHACPLQLELVRVGRLDISDCLWVLGCD